MSVKGVIGFRGMKPSGNELALPPGSLVDAVDCVIPSKDELMPRRGQKLTTFIDNDSSDANLNRAKELYQWGTHLFVHYSGNAGGKLALWKSWATSPTYSNVGSFTEPAPTVLRMKFAELARSVFFTTDAGLYTMALSTDTARRAGLVAPLLVLLDPDGFIGSRLSGNPSATGSWFSKNQTVAGRAVTGKKDGNGRLIISGSSGRAVIVNPNDVISLVGNLTRTGTTVTVYTSTAHKFRDGDVFALSPGEANFPAGNKTITSVGLATLTYTEAGAAVVSTIQQTLSSGTKSIQWSVFLPNDVAAGDFVRIYRTDETPGEAIDPGDECFLAYERTITATDVSNGYVLIIDTTPSSFLGEALDTNANSGDGPKLGFNERPPLMRDVCRWDGRLWGLETTDRHRLLLHLLGTGAPSGLQAGDLIAVNARVLTAGTDFGLYTAYLPTENVDKTTWHLAASLGAFATTNGVKAFQRFDGTTGLGEVLVEELNLASTMADGASGAISAIYAATSRASAWGDQFAATKAVTAASTARTLTTTVTVRCAGHGFVAGQVIMLAYVASTGAPDANFPVGLKTVATVVDANNFTYTESGANATLGGAVPYYAYATTFKSDNGKQLVRFSKQGKPEAWPLPNFPSGFPDGADGLRITPLPSGNGVLVALKDAGFWSITGTYPYVVLPLDDTADLVAADSLKKHNGRLEALTTQGIVQISEAGIGIVGGDVEDITRLVAARLADGSVSPAVVFGLSYESERQYQIYVPQEAAAGAGTVTASVYQALVLHSMLSEYTRWSTRRTCGLVWKGGDYLVLGDATTNQLRVERKTLTYLDFADAEYSLVVDGNQNGVSTIDVHTGAGSANLSAGDALKIGSTYYRVTEAGANSVTINGTVSVTDTQVLTAYARFSPSFTWAADSRGTPGVESRWRQLQLHFAQRLFSALTLTYKGEKSDTTGNVIVQDASFAFGTAVRRLTTLRAKVHDNFERVALQQVTATLAEALSYFRILGYSGSAEPITEKTGQ